MSYTPVGWKDYPEKATPTSARNLNIMESGIINNDAAITELQELVAEQAEEIAKLNNALGETVCAFGEIGVDNLTSVSATVRMQKLSSTKANFHISYRILSNSGTSNDVGLIDMAKVSSLLGINSFSFPRMQSLVNIYDVKEISGSTLIELTPLLNYIYAGYSGFIAEYSTPKLIYFAREYSNDGSFGGWALNQPMYQEGLFGDIHIYGATIS